MGFDLRKHTAKLALALVKEGTAAESSVVKAAGIDLPWDLTIPTSAGELGEGIGETLRVGGENLIGLGRGAASMAERGLIQPVGNLVAGMMPDQLKSGITSGMEEAVRHARSQLPAASAAPSSTPAAPAGGAPAPEFDPSRYTASFVQGMGPEDTESLLSAIQSGNIDPKLLTALPAMWRDERSRVSGEGNRIIQALVGAASANPEAMADPVFQRIWGAVKGNVEKAPSYREGLNAMLTAEEYAALGPGGAGTAASVPETPATPATPSEPERPEVVESTGPAVPFRSMTEPVTIPPQTIPMAPLPSAGGGKSVHTPPTPALSPQGLAGPSSMERDVADMKSRLAPQRTPLTGAQQMGQWASTIQPLPAIGAPPVRPVGTPLVPRPIGGSVKEQALRPILSSLGLLQGAMDKTASTLAKGAFEAMMQDLSNWAGDGASELDKIGMEAALSIPEDEDREAGSKIAKADALGRIMAAGHVAWLIKAAGGGSELSVEEQMQGRSYNNPTGQHVLNTPGYDANRGHKDDSTLELPTGNHQPGAH